MPVKDLLFLTLGRRHKSITIPHLIWQKFLNQLPEKRETLVEVVASRMEFSLNVDYLPSAAGEWFGAILMIRLCYVFKQHIDGLSLVESAY